MINIEVYNDEEFVKSTNHIYQWDSHQYVLLHQHDDYRFRNNTKASISVKGLDIAFVVPTEVTSTTPEESFRQIKFSIPDEILTYGKDIIVSLSEVLADIVVDTYKTILIPVVKRAKPENYDDIISGTLVQNVEFVDSLSGEFSVANKCKKVIIPDGVTSIAGGAFKNWKNLESVIIPDSVTGTLNGQTFDGCSSLVSVNIPIGITSIGGYAFQNCSSLTSITIPDSVTSIGGYAFSGCSSLASVTIPDSVTSIEIGVFSGCTNLTSITIPTSVTSIGNYAFNNCSNLTNIYYKGTEEQWNAITKASTWNDNMGSKVEGGTVITYNYTG